MNKSELTKAMSARLDLPVCKCVQILNIWQEILGESLSSGEQVMLQGFGSFYPWEQNSRPARNPHTGKACLIPRRTSVKFKPGKFLLKKLNEK